MLSQDVDVAVIGAGPAGLAAAIQAKEAGANNVTIIERAEQLGGLLHQCIHNGFGLFYFKEDLTGPEYARRFREKVEDLRIKTQLETMALSISQDKQVVASSKMGLINFNAKAIVLAMGCRERTRESILIPGTRPAGILTAGTAQRYVNVEGYLPGKSIVILGSGDVGMIMARRLTLEGAEVKAVVEILPYVGGLIRNEVQCLHDFGIPVLLKHTVTEVHGLERVEAVTIAEVDEDWEPIAGTEKVIKCDTLLTSVGLIPENELSLTAGIQLDPVTGGPIVNDRMETNIPGIFATGNVVHVHDLVDYVSWAGELAGSSAAGYARGEISPIKRKVTLKAGSNIRYVVPHSIGSEEEVTLYIRVSEPEEDVRLKIGSVLAKSLRVVKPGETLKVDLPNKKMEAIKEGPDELVISCERST